MLPHQYESIVKTDVALLWYKATENVEDAISNMKILLDQDWGKMPWELMSECYVMLGTWEKEICEQ